MDTVETQISLNRQPYATAARISHLTSPTAQLPSLCLMPVPVVGFPAMAAVHVLVVGHGALGDSLLTAFTSSSFERRIKPFLLVRPATVRNPASSDKLAAYERSGVTILPGDINEREALVDTLRKAAIHTVVSAVGHSAHLEQLSLLEAVKAAGVQRFVPSEFGFDESGMEAEHSPLASLLRNKRAVRDAMVASGVDWTVILVGAFLEWFIDSAFFGFDLSNNAVTGPGSLSAAVTLTALRDIGQLTGEAILDGSTRNTVVRLGRPVTYEEAADIVDAANGNEDGSHKRPPMARLTKSIEQRQAEIAADPSNLPARFAVLLAGQTGIAWPEEQTYSHQRGYRLRTLREAIDELATAQN